MKENAKLKEYFSGIYETALNWEKQNERLRAEARRQNDAAKYYCDLMLKYQGERDKAKKENAKLRKSREKLVEAYVELKREADQSYYEGGYPDPDPYYLSEDPDWKKGTKLQAIQSWIEWSEEKE
jgi:hypothetical protein